MIAIIILITICLLAYLYRYSRQTEHFATYSNIADTFTLPLVKNNILSRFECNDIIDYAVDKLQPDPNYNGTPVAKKYNRQVKISKDDPLIKPIIQYLSKLVDLPFERAEDPLIFKYVPFVTYLPNYDGCCDNTDKCRKFLKQGGQRVLALEIYLNPDFVGGETYFPNLNLTLKPEYGGMIIIHPQDNDYKGCHPGAQRQSMEVKSGTKWTMNVWFR